MTNIIKMDLTDTLVKEKLANLPENMLNYALEVIMEQAHLIAGLWQININVDTGSARDSIRVERGGEGLHWRQVRVRGGGYITNPKTGRLVDYMAIIEEKYGAGQAAFATVEPTIAGMIEARVVQKIVE
jgi:hypothetical protein